MITTTTTTTTPTPPGDSIWQDIQSRQPIVQLEFHADLLLAFLELKDGVKKWNAWVESMTSANILCPCGEDGEPDPIIMAGIDLSGADFSGMNLDNLNLSFASMDRTVNMGTSFRGAQIAGCEGALFHGAHLKGAMLGGCISGADFTGADLEGMEITFAFYEPDNPPIGLPPEILAQCRPLHIEPEVSTRLQARLVQVKGEIV
jgi:hypothetical protein